MWSGHGLRTLYLWIRAGPGQGDTFISASECVRGLSRLSVVSCIVNFQYETWGKFAGVIASTHRILAIIISPCIYSLCLSHLYTIQYGMHACSQPTITFIHDSNSHTKNKIPLIYGTEIVSFVYFSAKSCVIVLVPHKFLWQNVCVMYHRTVGSWTMGMACTFVLLRKVG